MNITQIGVVTILCLTSLFLGMIAGDHIGRDRKEREAIENNCGHYDTKNAEFKWGKSESKEVK